MVIPRPVACRWKPSIVLEDAEELKAPALAPIELSNFESFDDFPASDDTIGIVQAHEAMPRTLSRLRYKKPPVPIAFHGRDGRPFAGALLEQRVAAYVARQSNPRHVRLQVVANPKAILPATGKTVVHPVKPFTLRDVVDPEGKALHGEIIYVFRHNRTNQIIYSLQELLSVGNRESRSLTIYSHDHRTTILLNSPSLASTRNRPPSDQTIGHRTASSPFPRPRRVTVHTGNCASFGNCMNIRGTRQTRNGSKRPSRHG
jgi:hypothetical protein